MELLKNTLFLSLRATPPKAWERGNLLLSVIARVDSFNPWQSALICHCNTASWKMLKNYIFLSVLTTESQHNFESKSIICHIISEIIYISFYINSTISVPFFHKYSAKNFGSSLKLFIFLSFNLISSIKPGRT